MSSVFPGVDFLSYDMTISMFDAYLAQTDAIRAKRIIDMSEATIYAQATAEGRRSLYNSWMNTINRTVMYIKNQIDDGEPLLVWNGARVDGKGLVKQFKRFFGARSVV